MTGPTPVAVRFTAEGEESVAAAVRQLTVSLKELKGASDQAAAGAVRINTTATETAAVAHRAAQGTIKLKEGFASLAVQSVGVSGSLGSVVQGLLLFGGGVPLVLEVAAAVAVLGAGFTLLTSKEREAIAAGDRLVDTLNAQAHAALPAAFRAAQDYGTVLDALALRQRQFNILLSAQAGFIAAGFPGVANLIGLLTGSKAEEVTKALTAVQQSAANRSTAALTSLIEHANALASLRDAKALTGNDRSDLTDTLIALDVAKRQAKTAEERAKIEAAIVALTRQEAGARGGSAAAARQELTDLQKLDQELIARERAREQRDAAAVLGAHAPERFTIPESFRQQTAQDPTAPFFTPEQAARLNQALEATGDAALQKIGGLKTEVIDLGAELREGAVQSLEDFFARGIVGAESLTDALRNLLSVFAQLASKALITNLFGGTIGGAGGGIPAAPINPGVPDIPVMSAGGLSASSTTTHRVALELPAGFGARTSPDAAAVLEIIRRHPRTVRDALGG